MHGFLDGQSILTQPVLQPSTEINEYSMIKEYTANNGKNTPVIICFHAPALLGLVFLLAEC